MTKLALRGLLTRKLRSVLTGFAVVIGVAFVVGTLVFTDTIDESFKNLFERTSQGVDIAIEGKQSVKAQFSVPPTMPEDALEKVKATPGVEAAEGGVSTDRGLMLDKKGEPIVSQGPPTILASTSTEERFEVLDYEDGGRAPQNDNEAAIDRGTARKYGFKVGEQVTISADAPAKRFTISGISTIDGKDNFAGARLVTMTVPEAKRMSGHEGWDSISVATGGNDPQEVKAELQKTLGPQFLVRTGEEAAEETAADLAESLGFLRIMLLIFAGISLLVGGFLIFNTFTVTVAQRTKEFALLRVLGASRRQVMTSVLIETFAVGLVASAIGIVVGLGVAPALAAMMKAVGIDLGTTGIVVQPYVVVVGLVIGMVATMVSGFVPARRATRIEPVTAMRDSVTPGIGHLRRRRLVGSFLVMGIGLIVLFYGLFGGVPSDTVAASLIGLGALLMMFGLAFLAPLLVRPLARGIGAPLVRFSGLTGVLARENAIRQPQRTAVTAAALMIGLALVTLVAVLAAGLSGSTRKAVDDYVPAAAAVQNRDGFTPIPDGAVDAVARVRGVSSVSPMRQAYGRYKDDTGNTWVNGIDPQTVNAVMGLKWIEGDETTLAQMTDRDVVVDTDWAASRDLKVGSKAEFLTTTGKRETYNVIGIFKPQAGITSGVLLTNDAMAASWDAKGVMLAWVAAEAGTDDEQLVAAADKALKQFPATDALTMDQWIDKRNEGINQLLGLVYALLMLSVLVALLGIVNTLALSVHERTRELGMLRAVGMSRKQVRAMVRGESIITAGIGAVLGTILGVVFALVLSRPLASQGFTFILPVFTLIILFVMAGLAGVAAAIPPARRASRVDVLRAVTTE